ncbi:Zinc finger C2H2 [Penicillium angulare]|uniref:Zinc finger C2H2 n=1 Tax=Penicillium angulare TaxID=116970 RepID=A0A9W9FV18_9EURO|nr:Zinc finger C2H2 [Penicillium angulare]
MPPYLDSQYHSVPATIMENHASPGTSRGSPQRNIPPSPASSTTGSEFKVSKAKKGKRVHACEYPGCVKVFTRAEHRRRHELSHKSKKTYVCTHDGCTKAFHRADYLAQHVARHDPDYTISKSPSMRSNSTSSAVSTHHSQAYSSKSPVLAGFQSPVTSTSSRTPSAADQQVLVCSSCFNCQGGQAHGSPHQSNNPLYNYPPSSTMGLFASQSSTTGGPAGLDSVIDQYLRSVLRPEAFLPTQSQEQLSSSFWGSNIDPNLPSMNSSTFQPPTSYPWTSGAESMPSHVQTAHQMPQNLPRQERDS